jgi:dienelactone hydrolase
MTTFRYLYSILLVGAMVLPGSAEEPPFYAEKNHLLYYLDHQGRQHSVITRADWAIRRRHVLANMQLVMGPLPCRKGRPLDVRVIEQARLGQLIRKKLTFVSEDGDRVPAYLFLPPRQAKRGPAVLCLHPTAEIGKGVPAGIGGQANRNYARELAERGYVTLAPDYLSFGDYKPDPYAEGYVSGTMKGIFDHIRAIDFLASLPEVDPERIGVIGQSLGGHNSLFLAAFEPRVRVVVTSCGFTSFAKYYGGDLTGWTQQRYMPRIASVYEKSPAKMPFDFTEILGAIAPRPLFINAPLKDDNFEVSGVVDCVNAAMPVYKQIFHAGDRLVAVHPDCPHDFPPDIREQAYKFLDRWLKP